MPEVNWQNTTGLVGKLKAPLLMVFFCLKNPQFRIVKTDDFSYILGIRCRTKFYPELHHNYVEYF